MRFLLIVLCLAAAPAAAETLRLSPNGAPATLSLADGLTAHPAFAAFLKEDAVAYAEDAGADGARSFKLEDRVTRATADAASVLRRTETDLGARNPAIFVEALVWGVRENDFIRLDAFFDAGAPRDEALTAISQHLRETAGRRIWGGKPPAAYNTLLWQATNPDPAVLANFTIEPNGALAFHYSPKEIAPYEKGPISILTPPRVFEAFLNERGRAALR